MPRITLTTVGDMAALGRRWRDLERHAEPGFFRSWTFLGCLAEQRFAGASLLAATQDGCDVALGLLGRAHGRLWLNQTGSPALDAPFIEHNGLLRRQGQADPTEAALRHVVRNANALILSGVDDATLAAARRTGWVTPVHSRLSPCVRLGALDGPYLQTLSANARAQIRRSKRLYGPDLRLIRAGTGEQAQAWLAELMELHQASWIARGQPGAFAAPETRRFHQELVARAWPRGETDLLRIETGSRLVGLLYVFDPQGHVLSYQSGFRYDGSDAREKPGLVCHALAVEHYAASGARAYDLLAGAERYKLTLARRGSMLHWATLHPPWSVSGVVAQGRRRASLIRAALRPSPAGPEPS